MARIKVQITTPSNNVIKVSPGVSALSSVQLYLNELIDVNSAHGAEGHVLTQQSDGTFSMAPVATTLADLSDTNIPTPQGGDSLVYDDSSQKWVPGGVKSVNGEEGDVVIQIPTPRPTPGIEGLTDTDITNLQDNQIIRYDSTSGNWLNEDLEALPSGGTTGQALVKSTGSDYDVEWADIAIDTQYHNRFATDAETFRSGATDTVELYYTAKADGDGLAESASTDTPTAGKVIRRKIYYSEAAFADPDTGTWVEFTPAPADEASFATVKAALLEYLKARTGGTVPISLKQTWEEVSETAYLLDETFGSGAEAAYSIRQLRFAQTDCMVIRRASDSTTTTIGFVDGDIDEAAIETFCTGTTCTVYQWLDQSGNNNTATAPSTGKEPTIYTGGAIVKENRRVALDVNDKVLNTSSSITLPTDLTMFYVTKKDDTGTGGSVLAKGNNARYAEGYAGKGLPTLGDNNGSQFIVNENLNNNFDMNLAAYQKLIYTNRRGTTGACAINGSAEKTATATLTSSVTFDSITGNGGGYHSYDGIVQEAIFYADDKSGTDRTSIESNIGDYFTQNTPLLDTYSGAAAAYSLRLLDSTYTGSAVRVRRASNNDEQDIGFNVFGELDTVALANFCGSSDGFIRTWYDQSGNSNDAEQDPTSGGSAANQPKIYDGQNGVVTENGKPIIELVPGNPCTLLANTAITSANSHLFGVAKVGQSGSSIFIGVDVSAAHLWSSINSSGGGAVGTDLHINGAASSITTQGQVYSQFSNQTLFNAKYDLSSATQTRIGMQNGSGSSYKMYNTQEFILYTTAQTSTTREGIESNQNTFYNVYS